VAIEARNGDGQVQTCSGLVSGSQRPRQQTGNQEGSESSIPAGKKLAVLGHFNGVKVTKVIGAATRSLCDWRIMVLAHPLSKEKVRGRLRDGAGRGRQLKLPRRRYSPKYGSIKARKCGLSDEGIAIWSERHTTSDFSYRNRRFVGRRMCAWEMPPYHGTPFLPPALAWAMFSGKLAAEAVNKSLMAKMDGAQRLMAYEKNGAIPPCNSTGKCGELLHHGSFMEIFLEPRKNSTWLPP